jgi:hypothetical protein
VAAVTLFLASMNLEGLFDPFGLLALATLALIYAALSVAVTYVRSRRQARWLD